MNKFIKEKVKAHALRYAPYECVGYIVSDPLGNVQVLECENIHRKKRDWFAVADEDWHRAHEFAHVLAFYHSHCDDFLREKTTKFTIDDKVMSEECEISFLLYAHPNDTWNFYEPRGLEKLPFEGRPYVRGFWDCYTLLRDYWIYKYNHRLGYYFPPEDDAHANYATIEDNIRNEKAFEIDLKDIDEGDALCFKVLRSDTINHFGVYLGGNEFLHQPLNTQSRIDTLNDKWMSRVAKVYRHG